MMLTLITRALTAIRAAGPDVWRASVAINHELDQLPTYCQWCGAAPARRTVHKIKTASSVTVNLSTLTLAPGHQVIAHLCPDCAATLLTL